MSADAPILYDWSGAPVATTNAPITSRPGQALNTTAQGGMVTLGSDYSATPTARAPKIDANGSAYVVSSNPAGTSNLFYSGQPAPAAASLYGNAIMGQQTLPTPATFYPLTLDQTGSLNVHPKSKQTFRVLTGQITISAAGQLLLAFFNSSAMVARLNEMAIYVPPSGQPGSLLGSNVTYFSVFCNIVRTSTVFTGGTAITPAAADSADALASGITCSQSPTASGTQGVIFHRADAYLTILSGIPYYGRYDPNEKTLVLRPGEGFVVICTDNGLINNNGASGTTPAKVYIEAVFTQAVA